MTQTKEISSKKRNSRRWPLIATTYLLLLTSGCVTPPEDPQADIDQPLPPSPDPPGHNAPPEEGRILASSVTTATDLGPDLQIDVYALERLENNFLRLNIGITNQSDERFDLGFGLGDDNNRLSASQVSLVDDQNQQRYLSYSQSDGKCFCNSLEGALEGGDTENLWIIYPEPPADLENMTILTPLTPPLINIPISRSSESLENNNLEDPEILDLTMISDSLEGDQTGRTESGDEVSIILSSDVLFDTNSAELTEESEEILKQVAQEIDDSNSTTVSIDGHADNTGSDSVNIPLSKERAESVESSLSELITREGVTFEIEGHGSADPIADNDTNEGRERNRRVSVTFEK
ncbi:OmpA family protein [Nocardiopsis alba]|uniref:OmpA family protein n=1 Tax=Nocardiopsis alba TaxID=53437 RepID=UPI0033F80CFF